MHAGRRADFFCGVYVYQLETRFARIIYEVLRAFFALRGNVYVPFYYTLVVRDATNSSTGGRERKYYGLHGKTGEILVVIDTRFIIKR